MGTKKWDNNKKRIMKDLFNEYDLEDTCKRCKRIIQILGHDIPITIKKDEEEKDD